MMKQAISPDFPVDVCPSCGAAATSRREETESFAYGVGNDAETLTVTVPVYTCNACGSQFTDDEAEDRRHAAVCHHLGVLTPADIRHLRERNHLSRSDFALLTRLGEATIARWERGSLIQNAAYDQLLRLLHHNDNIQRLRDTSPTNTGSINVTPLSKFRYLTRTRELEAARAAFSLQKAKP